MDDHTPSDKDACAGAEVECFVAGPRPAAHETDQLASPTKRARMITETEPVTIPSAPMQAINAVDVWSGSAHERRGDTMAEVPAHRSGANHDATMDLVVGIVAAYVGHNTIASNGLPALIASVHAALIGIGTPGPEVVPQEPAVPVRGSVKPDSIACLECGKRFKSLKRHLRTSHDLRPTEYKAKWGLRSDYPMTAATSAEIRSKLAKAIGLGQKRAR